MYTFVFMWTPTLESSGEVPHGFVFACFMMSCSVGASVCDVLSSRATPEHYMIYVFAVAALSMMGPVLTSAPVVLMVCFCVFEVCVGIFWPSIMRMRSKYLPEEGRATIMNVFRIPLNFLVCVVLSQQGVISVTQDFMICSAAHAVCVVLQCLLYQRSRKCSLPASCEP
eukprot:TRINITY_DN107_c0_g1_i3.p3 TRINITY_DN107_c0_g1~~TRINITY_DN107_c0_g1_i3.p3  ORF type:complete len:169 (+),score=43.58 TRINITY_DN107_c0_g1_i3:322-828(+)